MSVAQWFTKAANRPLHLQDFDDLLFEQLKQLHATEAHLLDGLQKLATASHAPDLKQAFEHHRQETETHRRRVDDAFRELGRPIETQPLEALRGLLAEADEAMSLDGDPCMKDSALIAVAQRIEHFEIACYASAKAFAEHQGRAGIAGLFALTLEEETRADETLTKLANRVLTPDVAHRS